MYSYVKKDEEFYKIDQISDIYAPDLFRNNKTLLDELFDESKTNTSVLVIENINEIPLEEQTKFIEILKYKKVSTFELPKNCLVIVTCSDLTANKINEEVYSLLAQI